MELQQIIIRPWQESDAAALYKYASHPEVGPRAGWPPHKSVEESLEFIRTIFSNPTTWAIVLKETGEAMGCIGYLEKGNSNLPLNDDEAEVGYWIGYPYWNQGLCTQALAWLVEYCFEVKHLHCLWGDYYVDNPASGRVMEKCGFVDTGIETELSTLMLSSPNRKVRVMKLVH